MKSNVLYIGMILFFLALGACAPTRMQQELKYGKIQFEDGNFKGAFHRLLPIAYEGNREAQYAVGYMYYYGYGVARDEESAVFWLKRSAHQHDALAQQALKLIHRTPEPPQKKPQTEVQNSMLRVDATTERAKPEPGRYTLQLFGSNQLSDLQFLKKQLQLDNACQVATSEKHGKNWYVLTYGRYSVAEDARFARAELPENAQALKPWVRNTDDLRFLS